MKRTILLLMLAACFLLPWASAETMPDMPPETVLALIPADASLSNSQTIGTFHVLTLSLPTGEILLLTWDTATGMPISLITQATAPLSALPQSRDEAEILLQAAYPGANVLFARSGEEVQKTLCILGEALSGEVVIGGGQIVSRSLTCGTFARDGILTMEGALAALTLHRPDAEFRALELDEDDGLLVYEGDAYIGSTEYEFELNARNGQLIEWERD